MSVHHNYRNIPSKWRVLKLEPTVASKTSSPLATSIPTADHLLAGQGYDHSPVLLLRISTPELSEIITGFQRSQWVVEFACTRTVNCHLHLASVSILLESLVLFALSLSCPDCKDFQLCAEEALRVTNHPTSSSHTAPGCF